MSENNQTEDSQVSANDYRITNFLGAMLSVVAITLPMFGQKFFLPVFLIGLAVFLSTAALVTFWKSRFGTRFGWLFIALISSFLMAAISFVDLYWELKTAAPDKQGQLEASVYILPLIVFGACLLISLAVMAIVHFAGKFLMKRN